MEVKRIWPDNRPCLTISYPKDGNPLPELKCQVEYQGLAYDANIERLFLWKNFYLVEIGLIPGYGEDFVAFLNKYRNSKGDRLNEMLQEYRNEKKPRDALESIEDKEEEKFVLLKPPKKA